MDLPEVTKPHHFRAPWGKNVNFATKVWYPGWHSGCVPIGSKIFANRPSLPGSVQERNHDGTHIWMLVCLSLWVWVPSLQSQPQGKLWMKIDLQARAFKQCMTLHTENAGVAVLFWVRKGDNRGCVFRLLTSRNCLASETWDLETFPKDLTTRDRAIWLPAFSSVANTFQGHYGTAHVEASCGSVSDTAVCHPVVTKLRWHCTENGSRPRSWGSPSCFRNHKRQAYLVLSEISKKNFDWFSSRC